MNQNANGHSPNGTPDTQQVRDRRADLLEFEFVRNPSCVPVLRALAIDRLPLRAWAHLVVCSNCRRAEAELHSASRRGGFLVILLIAVVAIVVVWLLGAA